MILALEEHGAIAGGIASALRGTLQMVLGAAMIGLVSATFDGTTLPMVLAIGGCAALALLLSRTSMPRPALSGLRLIVGSLIAVG